MRNRASAGVLRPRDPLLHIERCLGPTYRNTLASDVRRGLTSTPKSLPSKYFYDRRGSQLFDAICDLPEYYLTRTDTALLRHHADELAEWAAPSDVIELGSGGSRKTRFILDACARRGEPLRYVPMDVSEAHLREAAETLRRDYPDMEVYGIAGDYERHLDHLPSGDRRLVLFLGSTIGNFTPAQATAFVRAVAERLSTGDVFLIGMDLVKPLHTLLPAYNDTAGLTAEFNRNVLHVVNRDLGANFRPDEFDHVAFFNEAESQIEMHLRAVSAQKVRIPSLDLAVSFAENEMIHTEISRKFRREDAVALFAAAGCRLERWWTDEREWFAEAVGVKI